MRKGVFILTVLLLALFPIYSIGNTDQLPKKVKIITQSSTAASTHLTVIDLENNEIVIIVFGAQTGKIMAINRTGIVCDPDTQNPVPATDAPFSSN